MALLEKALVVKPSGIPQAGNGLYTTQLIPKGTRIVEYKGKVTNWKQVRSDNGDNGYIYFMNRSHVIDASRSLSALARYSNDARGLTRIPGVTNNAEYVEDGAGVYIVSKKEIGAGEEIFVGYGPEYWKTIRFNIKIEKDRAKEAAAKKRKAEKAAQAKTLRAEKAARVKAIKAEKAARAKLAKKQARKAAKKR